MSRFATIELNSGYVWWAGEAASPTDACIMSHAVQGGHHSTEWDPISRSEINSTAGGYAVHTIPESLMVDDGQDADTIEAVAACPLAGYFRRSSAD